MTDMHDATVSTQRIASATQRHLDDGHRPTVAIARALIEHVGTECDHIGTRAALDVAEQLAIDVRVVEVERDVALLIKDAPGRWSGLLPDYDGIAWVPIPARTLTAMGGELLCTHDAEARLAS